MAEENKSQLISEAELIEAINADSIISVSLGAGQPQKNVKLSTLASVVAGLISFPYTNRGYIYDANSAVESGYYRGMGSSTNLPANYGVILVFATTPDIVLQLYFPSYNMSAAASWRMLWQSAGWTEWKTL